MHECLSVFFESTADYSPADVNIHKGVDCCAYLAYAWVNFRDVRWFTIWEVYDSID
jgi:hypothetical protein